MKVSGVVSRFDKETQKFINVEFEGVVEQEVELPSLPNKLTYVRVIRATPARYTEIPIIHVSDEDPPLTLVF